jgi:hypothetical protein
MPRKGKSSGGFRINRKAFGLTYSCPRGEACRDLPAGEHHPQCKCENPIKTHKELIEFLDGKGVHEYIVGKEAHKSGKTHWHAYVKYDTIIDSTDARIFDCNGVHPNIVDGAPGKGWQAYCTKDKEYETNFYGTNPFKKATLCDSAEEAIDMLWQTRPEDMCKHGDRIEENLRKRLGAKHLQKRYDGPYPQEFYPSGWDPDTHALLIVGPPGLGKTQFARYLLGDCDYIKGDLEPLRKIRFDKPILFDEVHMLEKDPEQSKEITDIENGGTIHMRFKNVQIPPGIRRVFVHNKEHPFRNPSGAVYGRRVHTHIIDGPCAQVAAAAAHAAAAAAHASAAAEFASSAIGQMMTQEDQTTLDKFMVPGPSSAEPVTNRGRKVTYMNGAVETTVYDRPPTPRKPCGCLRYGECEKCKKTCGCGTWTSCNECRDDPKQKTSR